MKYLLGIVLLLIGGRVSAQQLTYAEWKAEAKENIRLLPEYGHAVKTAGQIEADNEFIKEELAKEKNPRIASDNCIKRGFDYLYKGEIKTAMYRFNQAWLLDSKNENVYWGFGTVYFYFNDPQEALTEFNKGLAINPNSDNILTDIATISYIEYYKTSDKTKLVKALELLKKSYSVNKKNQNTLFKLSVCYFLNDDCANAWKYYNECKTLGGDPITDDYTKALKEKCKN